MSKKLTLLSLAFATSFGLAVQADENAQLVIEGEELTIKTAAPDHLKDSLDEIYSGWVFRSDETQALQLDDFDNPAFVFIDTAMDLFSEVDGAAEKSCESCHEDVEDFKGLRTSMPRVVDGKIQTMEDQINTCQTEQMGADAWK